jgi:hypothetical protein
MSPAAAHTYVLLAEDARSIEEARKHYAKGVEPGGARAAEKVQNAVGGAKDAFRDTLKK